MTISYDFGSGMFKYRFTCEFPNSITLAPPAGAGEGEPTGWIILSSSTLKEEMGK